MVLKLKDGTEAEIGMIISDVDGIYEIQGIDEARRLCLVQDLYADRDGSTSPVGDRYFVTFQMVRTCERW